MWLSGLAHMLGKVWGKSRVGWNRWDWHRWFGLRQGCVGRTGNRVGMSSIGRNGMAWIKIGWKGNRMNEWYAAWAWAGLSFFLFVCWEKCWDFLKWMEKLCGRFFFVCVLSCVFHVAFPTTRMAYLSIDLLDVVVHVHCA